MTRTQAAGKKKWVKDANGWKTMQRLGGKVDWSRVQNDLSTSIILRGGGADEAPEVYRQLNPVLAAHGETIKRIHTLTPKVVIMAGADTHDPYKD